ncbi:MAG: carboxypeptidase-like regulatory domain-containing protein, partial [Ignavibacteria bacterium]|nr:carboxypeptidase-like regulatory domain-containing protein [Ignavibacteria bacterium]
MSRCYKKLHIVSLLAILFFSYSLIFAQGTISGKVTDVNGDAIVGANVFLKGTTMGAATNIDGNYKVERVPAGTYTLRVSSIGYKPVESSLTITDGETTTQNVTLAEDILQMEGVVITGTAGGSGIKKKDASFS